MTGEVSKIELEPTSFDFSMCHRNLALCEGGVKPPTLTSTGTTIVAALYKVFYIILFNDIL